MLLRSPVTALRGNNGPVVVQGECERGWLYPVIDRFRFSGGFLMHKAGLGKKRHWFTTSATKAASSTRSRSKKWHKRWCSACVSERIVVWLAYSGGEFSMLSASLLFFHIHDGCFTMSRRLRSQQRRKPVVPGTIHTAVRGASWLSGGIQIRVSPIPGLYLACIRYNPLSSNDCAALFAFSRRAKYSYCSWISLSCLHPQCAQSFTKNDQMTVINRWDHEN